MIQLYGIALIILCLTTAKGDNMMKPDGRIKNMAIALSIVYGGWFVLLWWFE